MDASDFRRVARRLDGAEDGSHTGNFGRGNWDRHLFPFSTV